MTEYHYDADGRLEASVSRSEVEWDQEQLDLALAFDAFKRDLGPNGELLSEAVSDHADPNYHGPGSFRYLAHGPFTNYAEKAHKDAEAAYRKEVGEKANLNGMFWTIEKKTF